MDTNEAVTLLGDELGRLRVQSYEALVRRTDAEPVTTELVGRIRGVLPDRVHLILG